MHPTNFWRQLHIQRHKITVGLLFFMLLANMAKAQENIQLNLPFSDSRWLHYGFSIGLHTSTLKLKYSDKFITHQMDSVHSIMSRNSFGFSLGFITDFRLQDQFNVRILPKVSFYEYGVDYFFTDGTTINQLIEATFIEVPFLLKYKSERHQNFRMYLIGGITPGFEVSGKKRKENSDNKLQTKNFNLSADVGIGMDMYFPLFKFSPEIRLSRGLLNLLKPDKYGYSDGIKELRTSVVTFYFQFSD